MGVVRPGKRVRAAVRCGALSVAAATGLWGFVVPVDPVYSADSPGSGDSLGTVHLVAQVIAEKPAPSLVLSDPAPGPGGGGGSGPAPAPKSAPKPDGGASSGSAPAPAKPKPPAANSNGAGAPAPAKPKPPAANSNGAGAPAPAKP
ncbi:MAG TPA: hypothetical protein VHU91_03370, partial [Mycobacteriales bacterium]|nr:hypothetical protein [Mycobacteriales bacterium]